MSKKVDEERAEEAFNRRIERGKQVLRDMQDVLRHTASGLRVPDIARQMGTSRRRVYRLQRQLELLNRRARSGWRWTPETARQARVEAA